MRFSWAIFDLWYSLCGLTRVEMAYCSSDVMTVQNWRSATVCVTDLCTVTEWTCSSLVRQLSCLITCSDLGHKHSDLLTLTVDRRLSPRLIGWIWCNLTVAHFCNSNLLSPAISTQMSQVNMERKIVCVGLCVLIKQIFILFGLHIIQCLADCLPCENIVFVMTWCFRSKFCLDRVTWQLNWLCCKFACVSSIQMCLHR